VIDRGLERFYSCRFAGDGQDSTSELTPLGCSSPISSLVQPITASYRPKRDRDPCTE